MITTIDTVTNAVLLHSTVTTACTVCYPAASRKHVVQVHRAVLHSGEQVVIKVQRPGLKNLFDSDMSNLRVLAKQMDRTDENSDFM